MKPNKNMEKLLNQLQYRADADEQDDAAKRRAAARERNRARRARRTEKQLEHTT